MFPFLDLIFRNAWILPIVSLKPSSTNRRKDRLPSLVSWVSGGSDGKGSACIVGDLGSIPGLGRSPGGGHGNPLQYSCLENPHGERSLADYSHVVTKSWTRSSDQVQHGIALTGFHWSHDIMQTRVKNAFIYSLVLVQVRSLGREDPLGEERASHSNILAWRIPWTEEPGRLQSVGSQRV